MIALFAEDRRAEQHPAGREPVLQVLEHVGLAVLRAGQAMQQVEHGDGIEVAERRW